jgi:hypothetical protein
VCLPSVFLKPLVRRREKKRKIERWGMAGAFPIVPASGGLVTLEYNIPQHSKERMGEGVKG